MIPSEKATDRSLARHRLALAIPLVAVLVAQALLTIYFAPPEVLFEDQPLAWADFSFHVSETGAVRAAFDEAGASWAYDPRLLAGYPAGAVFDCDNKAWELFALALEGAGVPPGLAFNLFVYLVHLLVPLAVYFGARLFDLSIRASAAAASAGVALWFFDSFIHYSWYIGMVTSAGSSYFVLLPLAFLHRFTDRGGTSAGVGLVATLGAAHLLHPFSFVALVIPMTVLYAVRARALPPARHLVVAGAVVFTLALNAYWLSNLLRFSPFVREITAFCQADGNTFVADILQRFTNPAVTGWIETHTGARLLVIAAAAATFLLLRRRLDLRLATLLIALIANLAIAYLGSGVWLLAQTQPYRFAAHGSFFAIIPAAALVDEIPRVREKLPVILVAVLLAAPAALLFARDIPYFLSGATLSSASMTRRMDGLSRFDSAHSIDIILSSGYRYHEVPPDFPAAAEWARGTEGAGRILVEWWPLGEYLASNTGAQILGGFPHRNLLHAAANPPTRLSSGDSRAGTRALDHYLAQYAVRWLVMSRHFRFAESRPDILKPVGIVGDPRGRNHKVFRVLAPTSLVVGGVGEVRAEYNRLRVTGTDPRSDTVLRFHWLDSFTCRPGCRITREPLADDPVGFIRVHAPHPSDFTVENSY